MTSRCSEDRKGRAKINCCVTATPFPLGLSTVPPGSSAGLGSGWVARSLGPDVLGFFCVFFSLVRAFGSPGKKIFLGPFVWFFFFFPPLHPFAVTLFSDKGVGLCFLVLSHFVR